MKTSTGKHREFLLRLASDAMRERGFEPEFSRVALASLENISGEAQTLGSEVRDLRKLLWCSIDNDDSRDLDQLTFAEEVEGGRAKILIAYCPSIRRAPQLTPRPRLERRLEVAPQTPRTAYHLRHEPNPYATPPAHRGDRGLAQSTAS